MFISTMKRTSKQLKSFCRPLLPHHPPSSPNPMIPSDHLLCCRILKAINADTSHLCPFQATRSKAHQPAPLIDTASQLSIWQAGFRRDANGVVRMFASMYGSRIRAHLVAQDVGDRPRRMLPHHDYSCSGEGLQGQFFSAAASPELPHRNSGGKKF